MRGLRLSRTGRWLAVVHGHELQLIDVPGSAPKRTVALPAATEDVAFVGKHLWVLTGTALERFSPAELTPIEPRAILPVTARHIVAGGGPTADEAVLIGAVPMAMTVRTQRVLLDPIDDLSDGEHVVGTFATRLAIAGPSWLRMLERPRGELWRLALGTASTVRACAWLFGGKALAVLLRDREGERFLVVRAGGAIAHIVKVPASRQAVFAEELGHAFLLDDSMQLCRIDLRYGRVMQRVKPVIATDELAVDQDGRTLVLAEAPGGGDLPPAVFVMPVADLFSASARAASPAGAQAEPHPPESASPANGSGAQEMERNPDHEPTASAAPARPTTAQEDPPSASHTVEPAEAMRETLAAVSSPPYLQLAPQDASDGDSPVLPDEAPPVAVPSFLPLAFGPPPSEPSPDATTDSPYPSARAHLDALLDLVASRVAVAIAEAWNTGRLSSRDATRRPYELEVGALIGGVGGFAAEKLTETMRQVEHQQREASARAAASAARGVRLPFPELAREIGLSAVAAQILLLVAAPALRGEIGRLYGVLSNDPARPTIDRFLIEQIVAGGKSALRDQIARELAADAPLVRFGVVRVEGTGLSLYARLVVSEPVLDRLRGLPVGRGDEVTTVRGAEHSLDQLHVADAVKRELVLATADPRQPHDPLRLVVRGRRGSGRHAVIAALADRIGREIAAIDTTRMSRSPRELAAALRAALFHAGIHGLIPVVSGLEQVEPVDTELREVVKQIIRIHPGPVVVRTSPEAMLPIDPGFVSVTLPPLSETERVAAWTDALAEVGLTADVDALAGRYRCGPGVVARVVAQVAARTTLRGDITHALEQQVKTHVAARLDHVATRVTRRAGWEDVALPEDLLDSLREFIGRARHRRTVYERWGYDSKMTTARGLTALFYGPPGTGKTMVAGLISNELGLELYRVDLARVVSKWLGETEKNLAEVFDAAEDGQVLILFDEADSLFAKRTEVKTSNDRYSNLEVNYLLQRLDSFEGVAVLTSNQDSAIDPAFRRRLSLRLQFPFPDEDMRVRLWQAHVTPQTPTVGDIDFIDLARRFPLSGGYIRNASLRAAFLAAHEGVPMTHDHLLRAVHLEYRELGKLSTTSRIE